MYLENTPIEQILNFLFGTITLYKKEIINTINFSSIAWQILTPLIFSLADVITGFIQAVINKNVDSQVMRTGLLHKVLITLIVLLSFVADLAFSLNFISRIVCIYVVIMETTSILENLKKAGMEVGKLTSILLDKRKEGK